MKTILRAGTAQEANDNAAPPKRTASGLPLAMAKMLDINPYRAPHANRGTPAKQRKDRSQQRLRLKAVTIGGHILNAERGIPAKYLNGWRQKMNQQARELARREVKLAEAA